VEALLPMVLADSAVELARWQFALTTLTHFVFVPVTLGLAPILAIMQTLAYRRPHERERWERLVRFFGVLFLINFAIGAATGLLQEFQFGMNWSVFSRYVGGVFGAPLAIEGLGAFMLESTFIGLWIFGRGRLSPKVHLATIYMVWLGTWLSAYFIIAANSWMQHPVGYEIEDGKAEANDILAILFQWYTIASFIHVILAGLMTAGFLVLGVAAWHLLRRRNSDLFPAAAALAITIVLPVTAVQLVWGSELGVFVTDVQPIKIAATEALWESEQPAGFSLFQIGGFTADDPTPSFDLEIPYLLSFLATNRFTSEVVGLNPLQEQYEQRFGPGTYYPDIRLVYWSMRVMAYLGSLLLVVALWGWWLKRRQRLATSTWFQRVAIVSLVLPFLCNFAGWVLKEAGRQPWVVYFQLKTEDAVSTAVSASTVAFSLGVWVALYSILGVFYVILMRRYARQDPPPLGVETQEGRPAVAAPTY
jgi:cytochrome d ubiquinol oxidase subunit I